MTTALQQSIADAAPVLIWSAALDRSEDWFSASWSVFSGLGSAELKNDGWTRAVHPEDVGRCLGIRAASFEARTAFSLDLRLRRADGAYRWMLDNGVPRFDGAGECLGFVGTLVDIDVRKALEDTLAERTRQMRLAERRQGHFLAMLSHELRNPLAPIANAASVLRTLEHSNPILLRLREILDRQVARFSTLIEELIDATRAAQGQISLVRAPVSVSGIVEAAAAVAEEKLLLGGHRLEIEFSAERLQVRGDSARLTQALLHLIVNAGKFSLESGVVRVVVRHVAKTVQITVADQGQGIASDFLPHVFELFARQDQSLGRTLAGLGVGLTLARRIAQLHGGDVEAFSEGVGKGSEFVLWLPLIDTAAALGTVAESSPDMVGSAVPTLARSLRVLIVEDELDALESLRMQMQAWGTEVSTATNADDALEVAAQVRPQIVLCDLGLPGVDGLRLVGSLRRALADSTVIYAAVTGYAGNDDQERALNAGFDAFFVKPLDPESLARLLHTCSDRPG